MVDHITMINIIPMTLVLHENLYFTRRYV